MAEGDLTTLLEAHSAGDPNAMHELVAQAYPVLKALASRQILDHRNATLNTTALVHDAFVRFVDRKQCNWESRDHFLAFAARVMRQVVVDYYRARFAAKRGAGEAPLPLNESAVGEASGVERALLIDQLLDGLAEIDERLVRVVECRYFAGLTEPETATVLGVTTRTVQRDWRRARAWLEERLGDAAT